MRKRFTLNQIQNTSARELNNMSKSNLSKYATDLFAIANKRIKRLQSDEITAMSPALRSRAKDVKGDVKIERSKGKEGNKAISVKNLKSPSLKFSSKGMNRNRLLKEVTRARRFLQMETSTIEGMEKTRKNIVRAMKGTSSSSKHEIKFEDYEKLSPTQKKKIDNINRRLSREDVPPMNAAQSRRFWRIYNKISGEVKAAEERSKGRWNSTRAMEDLQRLVTGSGKGYINNETILNIMEEITESEYKAGENQIEADEGITFKEDAEDLELDDSF